ncbi:MAG: hypothetical protein ACRDBQ_18460 [Shewanella sp.]
MRLLLNLEGVLSAGANRARELTVNDLEDDKESREVTLKTLRYLVDSAANTLANPARMNGWLSFSSSAFLHGLRNETDPIISGKIRYGFFKHYSGSDGFIDQSKLLESISMAARTNGITNWTDFRLVNIYRNELGTDAVFEIEIGSV